MNPIRFCIVGSLTILLSACASVRDTHERLHGVLWMQTSAEYRILSETIFQQAQKALDAAIVDTSWTAAIEQTKDYSGLPNAVILDIDETVLDNSPFQGQLVINRSDYDHDLFGNWINLEKAIPIPGSSDFIKHAVSNNVAIFFITNREFSQEASTIKNLTTAGFPATPNTVLSKKEKPDWGSDKSSRRKSLAEEYRILLLIGDDLGDFVAGSKASPEERIKLAADYKEKWGRQWFLIPNPLYGSWEMSLYQNEPPLTDEQILAIKRNLVRGFK